VPSPGEPRTSFVFAELSEICTQLADSFARLASSPSALDKERCLGAEAVGRGRAPGGSEKGSQSQKQSGTALRFRPQRGVPMAEAGGL